MGGGLNHLSLLLEFTQINQNSSTNLRTSEMKKHNRDDNEIE